MVTIRIHNNHMIHTQGIRQELHGFIRRFHNLPGVTLLSGAAFLEYSPEYLESLNEQAIDHRPGIIDCVRIH